MAKFGVNTRLKVVGGSIQVNMEGNATQRWLDRIARFQLNAEDLSVVFGEFGQYMLGSIDRNFEAGGRPKWSPLNRAYARYKARFTTGGILVWTGGLRRGFRYRTTPKTLQIYNNRSVNGVNLFKKHQEGDSKTNLPARPMMLLQSQDRAQLSKILRKQLYG